MADTDNDKGEVSGAEETTASEGVTSGDSLNGGTTPGDAEPNETGQDHSDHPLSPSPETDAPGAGSEFYCIAVGASAGGLEAISSLLTNVSPDLPAAIITAQHMAPQHRSMLAELLAKNSKFKVVNITDGMTISPGYVYVNPPSKDIVISEGAIKVITPSIQVGPRPSIDKLFHTVGEYYGPKAVGVVLSGTGSDGTVGCKAIRDGGGITIVQDPDSAKFDGMPNSVIRAKLYDALLTPEEIAEYLKEITAHSRRPDRSSLPEHEEDPVQPPLEESINLVENETGVDFSGYKRATLERQLMRRVIALRFNDPKDYISYLKDSPEEVETLQRSFLISVTGFFRDEASFEALRGQINYFKENGALERGLRIWVPACATGEEVYSIAIMLAEHFGPALRKANVRIYATDIDDIALEVARRGLYPEAVVEGLPKNIIFEYFEPQQGGFRIHKWIRDMCIFARHNVLKDAPFLRMDLISCRNLLIYLSNNSQQQVLASFHYSLSTGGLLFLGRSESLSGAAHEYFATIDKDARLYRAMRTAQLSGRFASFKVAALSRPRSSVSDLVPRNGLAERIAERGRNKLLQRFAPSAVVTDESLMPIEFIGDVAPFMGLPKGRAEFDVIALANMQLQVELRAILGRVRRSETDSAEYLVNYRVPETGELIEVMLSADVLTGNDGTTGYLLSFTKRERPALPEASGRVDTDSTLRASDQDYLELEEELKRTQDHLQAVIEELETSNEELQSLNEELQASTEELQASNEELETTNEELQATNEELSTVNDELQAKSLLLTESNETLTNIQNSLDLGILLVDRDIRVKRFTPSVVRLFGIMEGDVGQRLSRIPTQLEVQDMDEFIGSVIREGLPRRLEVEHAGLRYLISVAPYRTEMGAVSGAVLTFSEVSELRESAAKLLARDKLIHRLSDEMQMAVWAGRAGFRGVMWMNGYIEKITARSLVALQTAPELLFDWVIPDDAKRVRETYRDPNTTGFDIVYGLRLPDDRVVNVQETCTAFMEEDGTRTLLGRLRIVD